MHQKPSLAVVQTQYKTYTQSTLRWQQCKHTYVQTELTYSSQDAGSSGDTIQD